MATETLTRGALPRIQWSPVITGVLCALAVHIVLGLFGAAFGFAADPADSEGLGIAAGLWALVVPLLASFVGAMICVRIARPYDDAGAYLHGALVWCIGLIAGAIFLTSTLATSAMTGAAATAGNVRGGVAERDLRAPRNDARAEEAAKAAAATAGAGALGALLGLGGALLGAAAAGRALRGEGYGLRGRRMATGARGYREDVAHAERTGVVSSTTRIPDVGRTPTGEGPRPGEDPTIHH